MVLFDTKELKQLWLYTIKMVNWMTMYLARWIDAKFISIDSCFLLQSNIYAIVLMRFFLLFSSSSYQWTVQNLCGLKCELLTVGIASETERPISNINSPYSQRFYCNFLALFTVCVGISCTTALIAFLVVNMFDLCSKSKALIECGHVMQNVVGFF